MNCFLTLALEKIKKSGLDISSKEKKNNVVCWFSTLKKNLVFILFLYKNWQADN